MLFCVGKDGQFVLAMSNLFGNTSFYGYDGWRFYETKVQPKDDIFRNADGLYFHMQHEIPMFIVKNSRPNITLTTKNYYTAKFMKTFPQRPVVAKMAANSIYKQHFRFRRCN